MKAQTKIKVALLFAWAGIFAAADGADHSKVHKRVQANSEWRLIGLNAEQQHFSALTQINDRTVKSLGLAWYADLPTEDGPSGVPLVADGVVYESGNLGRIFANDVRTGKALWVFDAQIRFPMGVVPSWGARVSRGVGLWEDKVFIGTGDCRLIAVDRKTGTQRWEAQACDPKETKTITGAPRVGGGKVFIGNSNGDSGIGRGHVDAFDAATGKHLWRFYTIPGDPAKGFESKAMEMASKTWGKEYWKKTGGGSAWDALTYDPELNLLYIGTDGPAPFNPMARGDGRGDELFTNSIVALNADTGEYVWHYQTTPNDGWNYAAAMHIMIAELTIDGQQRRVVMQAPKNGFYYVLDAQTGKLLSAKNIVPVTWASHIDLKSGRPVVLPDAKYWLKGEEGALVSPSPVGAHNWMPMSYSPRTGLVYIPVMEGPALFSVDPAVAVGGVQLDLYYPLSHNLPFKGSLIAWDPIKQQTRWKHDVGPPYEGGVLSTAGNLVFQGTTNGELIAYRADTGEKLWSTFVGSGILAAPSTVEIDGEQLIIVPGGSGTTTGQVQFARRYAGTPGGPARLFAFKLNGKAQLPKQQPFAEVIPKPPRPRPDQSLASRGRAIWDANGCELCHGYKVIGALGSVPDLRKASALTHDLFPGIVLGGLYKDKGMPMFSDSITADELATLQAYILQEAWKAYDTQESLKVRE